MKMVVSIALFLVLVSGILTMKYQLEMNSPPLRPVAGLLSLSDWQTDEAPLVTLRGDWLSSAPLTDVLAPEKLLTAPAEALPDLVGQLEPMQVPGLWHREDGPEASPLGARLYRLVITGGADDQQWYALGINKIRSAHAVSINGVRMPDNAASNAASNATSNATSNAASDLRTTFAPYMLRFQLQEGQADIRIYVANSSNYMGGGIVRPLLFGLEEAVAARYQFQAVTDMITLVIIGMSGGFSLLLFRMRSRQWENLYFATAMLMTAIYVSTLGYGWLARLFPGMDSVLHERLQWVSIFSLGLAGILFVHNWFRVFHNRLLVMLSLILAGCGLFIAIAPVALYSSKSGFFYGILCLMWMALLFNLIAGTRQKKQEAAILLFILGGFLVNFVYVVTFVVLRGYGPVETVHLELLLTAIGLTYLIYRRWMDAFAKIQQLADELRQTNRFKNVFLLQASHQMRTPLQSMLNIVQAMGAEQELQRLPHVQKQLQLLTAAGKRMDYLLHDLLDYSRMREGTLAMYPQVMDMRAAAEHTMQTMPFLAEQNVKWEEELPTGLPLVWGDEQRVMQVLSNLLQLALKHADGQAIRLQAAPKGALLQISVVHHVHHAQDDERKALLCALTELTNQQQLLELEAIDGELVGLVISRRLVEQMGGTLRIEQTAAQLTYCFTLPLASEQQLTTVKQAAASWVKDGTGSTALRTAVGGTAASALAGREQEPLVEVQQDQVQLLLIEDDPLQARMIMEVLNDRQVQWTVCASGEAALERIAQGEVWQLALVDTMLGATPGLELCRALRARYTLTQLPILYMSTAHLAEDLERAVAAGANDAVRKPVDRIELRTRVRSLLAMQHAVKEEMRLESVLLQAQINPHFIYNGLNAIAAHAKREPSSAYDLLANFSTYLRGSFEGMHRTRRITLEKELQMVHAYISIEKVRYGDRFDYRELIDEGAEYLLLAPLLIQPLVENAVRHGAVTHDSGGWVRLQIEWNAEYIRIQVADNGPGIPARIVAEVLAREQPQRGIGLWNVQRRLNMLYGGKLDIRSEAGQGTILTLQIPVHERRELL